jgi:hypothetical protein
MNADQEKNENHEWTRMDTNEMQDGANALDLFVSIRVHSWFKFFFVVSAFICVHLRLMLL